MKTDVQLYQDKQENAGTTRMFQKDKLETFDRKKSGQEL